MEKNKLKTLRRQRRKTGLRKRIIGTSERPRLSVHRSNKHMYAQIIDDMSGRTLAAASTQSVEVAKGSDVGAAKEVGKALAEKAKAAGVELVTFDRSGFKYHGRVKAVAEGAREAGLKF